MNIAAPPEALIHYNSAHFAHAKDFMFRMWCIFAIERKVPAPSDLSGACKYSSLFTQKVFGGTIEGNYAHQYNRIDGRRVDLSHDSLDVARLSHPYDHEPDYFLIPEYQKRLKLCVPRAERWAERFMREVG